MALLRRKLVLAVLVAFILTLLVILVLALLILLVAILVVVLVLAVVLVLILIVAHDFTPFCSYYDPGIKFLYKGERMMERLPKEFLSVMEPLLGGNYSDFIQSFLQPPYRAVRLNPLKITAEKAAAVLPFRLSPAPFCSESYYIDPAAQGVGSHPLHHAGAYYVQEPSAAGAVTVLDPKPGDRVLDLCAAPGGKSTQIGTALRGKGLLWSNEFVKSRTGSLLSNVERMGLRNCVVSSCYPETLCKRLAGWFDKVLVDAPCSGEGMFRRNPDAVKEWSLNHTKACAQRQEAILQTASGAVKPGGVLVYSTCTFSPLENEGVVETFLKRNRDFELIDCGVSFGRPSGLPEARRIFPMDGGEGHFIAKLRKNEESFESVECVEKAGVYQNNKLNKEIKASISNLLNQLLIEIPKGTLQSFGETALLLPEGLPELSGLGVLRAGVPVGELRRGRVEPAHGLFVASRPEECRQVLNLTAEDPRVKAFLHGEEIDAPGFQGFAGISVEGVMTGFGKCSGGRMKNRYPKGLRTL